MLPITTKSSGVAKFGEERSNADSCSSINTPLLQEAHDVPRSASGLESFNNILSAQLKSKGCQSEDFGSEIPGNGDSTSKNTRKKRKKHGSSSNYQGANRLLKTLSGRIEVRKWFERKGSKKQAKMLPSRTLTCGEASAMDVQQVRSHLDVDVNRGLTSLELSRRRDVHGANEVPVPDPDPLWRKYLEQFKDPLIMLLLGSAFISVLMRQIDDAISITVAIIIVVTVGFVQEYRSEKTLERLGALLPPSCNVLRDGIVQHVQAKNLVPGDVVHLGLGDRIPADLRLFHVNELAVDESSLTGEPIAKVKRVEKHVSSSIGGALDINEMDNICFQGTLVTDGKGVGVVVCTGENSQFGEIFKKMQSEETPR